MRAATGSAGKEGEPAALSRDLANFLVELSIAFHKHAIYPAAHPLLSSAVHSVATKLLGLLTERPTLSIGIARRQLIIEGVATDPDHPLLHELANKLHRHHLGAVKFSTGITEEELNSVLATLAVDAGRMDRPLGLDAAAVSSQWQHAHVFPLTYDKLELLDETDAEGPTAAADGQMRAGRAAQLWVGMARAALAADSAVAGDDGDRALEPVAVARAIDEHQREQAYDQVIVGYMLQITDELKTGKGAETTALQRRISKMVGALQPETLERLLSMSGDNRQRRRFVLDAAQGMAVDAVVDLVRAAADAEHQTISHSLVRLFAKLAKHTSDADATRSVLADRSLRDQVRRLIADWSLDDPNPDSYSLLLQEISHQAPVGENRSGISMVCEPERIVKIGLETGTLGHRVTHAVTTMLERRQHAELFDILDHAPPDSPTEAIWRQIEHSATLRVVLTDDRVDFVLIARMVQRMKTAAADPLLDAVEAATDDKQRERLLDLLVSIGDEVARSIGGRLPTAPAHLQRDYLSVLGRLSRLPADLDLTPYATHPESIVRREAVRLLLRQDGAREATIVTALADTDGRTVFLGLTAAQEQCPAAAVPVIMKRVDRHELDAALRVLGIRAVAGRRDEATLPWLLGRVQRRTKWLKRLRLREKSPEMLAALGSLAALWTAHTDAETALAIARKSKDPDVRHAAASAAAGEGGSPAVR
jgi:RNase H-fold protein (predicted Holliday junction resolvase)